MFEYIFSQIVTEISNQLQPISAPEQKENILNGWRPRIKERMRQLEKDLKIHGEKYASDDFDQAEDNHKESHDKFSFCHFLIEDFIDEQVALATGKSLASVVSSSTHPIGSTTMIGGRSADIDRQAPPPFRWKGPRREVVNLVQYLSQVANGPSAESPSPEDIVAVSAMFVDGKGKQFPEKIFLPEPKPVVKPKIAVTRQTAGAQKQKKAANVKIKAGTKKTGSAKKSAAKKPTKLRVAKPVKKRTTVFKKSAPKPGMKNAALKSRNKMKTRKKVK